MFARKSARKHASLLIAGGTLLFGITLWTSAYSQSIDKPDTPLKVALVLDCIIQPRFQEDMKNFGMSRMMPTAGGHLISGQLALPAQKDRDLFKTAESGHRDFLIGFVHCAHVPGHMATDGPTSHADRPSPSRRLAIGSARMGGGSLPSNPPDASTVGAEPIVRVERVCNHLRNLYLTQEKTAPAETNKLYTEMNKAAQKALPKLLKGQGAEQDSGDWLIVTRPVRAMKDSCLKCHEGAKLGDTLGALAYVVSKKTFAAALPTSSPRPNASQ
ncbi:MAG: hypothetical protein JWN14_3926 [Chthonomonadales bacterium]|nr:hypothetical protein [Chthonomonadales bacterium]